MERFRPNEKVLPKRVNVTPIEDGLHSITGKPVLIIRSVIGGARRARLCFTKVPGEFWANEFTTTRGSGIRKKKPASNEPWLFNGLTPDSPCKVEVK